MARIRASFQNNRGETLAGQLETPDEEPKAYALFAHYFTCLENIAALCALHVPWPNRVSQY